MARPVGRLEVICGPMFAGKTTELLRRARAAESAGARPALFKPRRDDRYAHAEIVSHTGERRPAIPVASAEEIPAHLAADAAAPPLICLIDEAHFFGPALADLCAGLLDRGWRIIIAGVERDHRGDPFEPFPRLLCEADEVLKMSGPCALCGGPAVHSQRLFDSADRIVVGGPGQYEARCRACFQPGR